MKYKLGEICEIISGSTPKTSVKEYWDGDIKWITPAEILDDSYIVEDSVRKITELGVKETGLTSFPAGTVILSSRAPIGKVAIAGCEMYCNQGFKNLICSDKINNKYLYWFLKGNTAFLNSLGRGATFKEISRAIVSAIEINVPDINQQEKVVKTLEEVSQIIQMRKREIEELDNIIKARFVEMFGDRWSNSMNWHTQVLREVTDFYNGQAHEKVIDENGEYILVTSRCIASDKQDVRRTNAPLFSLHIGDICMVMSDVPKGRALAKCILIDKEDTYTLNQRICCFRNYMLNPIFFLYLLNRHEYFLSFDDGDSQTNLRKDDLLNCSIIIPPLKLQNKFSDFVQQVDKLKAAVQKDLEEAQTLFDSLMQEYFG